MPISVSPVLIFVLVLLAIIALILGMNIKFVPQSKAYVITRLGAFHTIWNVGPHFKIPIFEKVAKVVSLKEQVVDFPPQPVITKDNVTMQIDTVLYFQITDPKLYAYGVERPMAAIENLSVTTMRNIIGDMDLEQTLTSRDTINAQMRSLLDEATDPWGIKVNRVEVKNIQPPPDIQSAMEKQMKAEREKREAVLRAEGQRQSQILVAEGEKGRSSRPPPRPSSCSTRPVPTTRWSSSRPWRPSSPLPTARPPRLSSPRRSKGWLACAPAPGNSSRGSSRLRVSSKIPQGRDNRLRYYGARPGADGGAQ